MRNRSGLGPRSVRIRRNAGGGSGEARPSGLPRAQGVSRGGVQNDDPLVAQTAAGDVQRGWRAPLWSVGRRQGEAGRGVANDAPTVPRTARGPGQRPGERHLIRRANGPECQMLSE